MPVAQKELRGKVSKPSTGLNCRKQQFLRRTVKGYLNQEHILEDYTCECSSNRHTSGMELNDACNKKQCHASPRTKNWRRWALPIRNVTWDAGQISNLRKETQPSEQKKRAQPGRNNVQGGTQIPATEGTGKNTCTRE